MEEGFKEKIDIFWWEIHDKLLEGGDDLIVEVIIEIFEIEHNIEDELKTSLFSEALEVELVSDKFAQNLKDFCVFIGNIWFQNKLLSRWLVVKKLLLDFGHLLEILYWVQVLDSKEIVGLEEDVEQIGDCCN